MDCKICCNQMTVAFQAKVLKKHNVDYYLCNECGLLQTEQPYWLDEAYSDAIVVADTGILQRNILITTKLASLLYFEFSSKASYLDLAGGYGILTRLMRDYGFNFYWSDKYCQNLLARGFDADKAKDKFLALTAFEVLEHVHDPLAFVKEIMQQYDTRTLIFTTELYGDTPPSKEWWYYVFNTGQHISFYQDKTLNKMAKQLGLRFYSAHGIHMFTDLPINKNKFYWLTSGLAKLITLYVSRKMISRTQSDYWDVQNKNIE